MVIYGWLKVAFAICSLGKTCGGIFCLGKTCRRHLFPRQNMRGGMFRLEGLMQHVKCMQFTLELFMFVRSSFSVLLLFFSDWKSFPSVDAVVKCVLLKRDKNYLLNLRRKEGKSHRKGAKSGYHVSDIRENQMWQIKIVFILQNILNVTSPVWFGTPK